MSATNEEHGNRRPASKNILKTMTYPSRAFGMRDVLFGGCAFDKSNQSFAAIAERRSSVMQLWPKTRVKGR
uniref:Uncharacterized protein n=1 Tax=Arundo donax TaxID=35708 RepID=A0A0A9FX81_ARUDO